MIILTIFAIAGLIALTVLVLQMRNEIGFLKEDVSKKTNLHFDVQRAHRESSVDYSTLKNKLDELAAQFAIIKDIELSFQHFHESTESRLEKLEMMFSNQFNRFKINIEHSTNVRISDLEERIKFMEDHLCKLKKLSNVKPVKKTKTTTKPKKTKEVKTND